jgi:hypothetical protein
MRDSSRTTQLKQTPGNPGPDVHNKGAEHWSKALTGSVKQYDRSWLALLAFFAVTTLASSLFLAALLAGFTVAIAGGDPPQSPDRVARAVSSGTFSGVVTDALCGPRHTAAEENASDCARMCVRNGSRYIIVDGDRSYELAGSLTQIVQLAGQRATVTGVLEGNTIKVNSASVQLAGEGKQQ